MTMTRIRALLSPDEARRMVEALAEVPWLDGRVTAGEQSSLAKRNLQAPEDHPVTARLGQGILEALAASPDFVSAALPRRVFPPLFNRYGPGMGFGDHIDNAIRASKAAGGRYRTDLSCTLFLSDPDAYDGGELVIEDGLGGRRVKLPAGDAVLYPAGTVHRVEPVTRGERWASFFWVQSMAANPAERALLHDLDRAIALARADLGDAHAASIALVGAYHNLVRMWCEV